MSYEPKYRLLVTREDADLITDAEIDAAVDWFDGESSMPRDEFLDRLFPRHGGPRSPEGEEYDLDSLDNDAARRLIARARANRKERDL